MSGGRIPDEFIKDLLVRVDIVDLIDSHVPLKKSGANHVARCPFHTEKSPSFSVNRNKQFYHCFGCGVSGNAISFLMAFNHLNFVEAVEDLAAFAGVPIPKEQSTGYQATDKPDLNRLYGLMDKVTGYFIEQLRNNAEGKKAVAYLKKRGISREIAAEFMLGYATSDWRGLADRFDRQALLEAGMLVSKDDGNAYDRFRERIMFPIRDKRGRVIGFGGRVLDDSQPKYLNSPETSLFHKGQEVYGLHELLQKNPKPKRILLVEGYMDVIALAQSGLEYAVAALGTAVSQAHINLLFRFAPEIVLCFDGDNAGKAAAWRAMDAVLPCLKDGRQLRVMLLPVGHDPDSIVRDQGLSRFVEAVDMAQALSEYFFSQLLGDGVNPVEMEARAQLVNDAKPYLEKLPDSVFKDMMFARLTELSNVARRDNPVDVVKPRHRQNRSSAPKNSRPPLQRQALALLVQNPTLIGQLEEKGVDWQSLDFKGSDKFKDILLFILEKRPANTAILLEYFRDHADESIVRQLALLEFELQDGLEAEFNGSLDQLMEYDRSLKFERLRLKLESTGQLTHEERQMFKQLSMLKSKKFDVKL